MKKIDITITQVDKILELSKKGISLRDIGVLVGCSYESVRNIIKKYQKNESSKHTN